MHQHDHTTDPDLMGANKLPASERQLTAAAILGILFGSVATLAILLIIAGMTA